MSKATYKKEKSVKDRSIFKQSLTEDYWEGYYVLANGHVVKCSDIDGESIAYSVYSLRSGKKTIEDSFKIIEDATFREFARAVADKSGSEIYMRISNEAENPDRHDEIESILNEPDRFGLLRIQNLIKYLKNRSINIFGGKLGGRQFYDGECGGFYLLEKGGILFCRDLTNWDDSKVDKIVDGVESYRILDPLKFNLTDSSEQYFGYLQGDRFSILLESLIRKHGKAMVCLAEEGSEMYDILLEALNGDGKAAALASHKLKMNICIV
ncbi:MAG: hypothetical protein MJZ21_01565 [archaeon]|nr:hypothetical protein [archaeon]